MTVVEPRTVVLLAERHQDTRDMYAWYLRTVGFLVTEARDSQEAFQRAQDCKPDAIVMDLSLPGLGACAMVRQLRNHGPATHVPIIGLNGFGFHQYAESAVRAGCTRVLVKPCLPDVLAREIRRILMVRSRGVQNPEPPPATSVRCQTRNGR
jgi:CheY-like chemotaxis protein